MKSYLQHLKKIYKLFDFLEKNKKFIRKISFILEIIFVAIIVAENAPLFAQINSKILPFAILNALFLIYLKF